MYTIIEFYSVEEYRENDNCTVRHYADRKLALEAFAKAVDECEYGPAEGETVEQMFSHMLSTGCCAKSQSDGALLFVRNERIIAPKKRSKNK